MCTTFSGISSSLADLAASKILANYPPTSSESIVNCLNNARLVDRSSMCSSLVTASLALQRVSVRSPKINLYYNIIFINAACGKRTRDF